MQGPGSNEDTRYLRSLIGDGAYQAKSKTWNPKEEKSLAEGVRMQNLKSKLSPLLISLKQAQSKLNVDPVEVEFINKQIKEIRELPPRALEQDLECLDWEKLSMEYLPKRTAIECQLQWCHFGHPRVNRKPWTKHEDKMILQLTKDTNEDEMNWNGIAQTIQTNRTPLQCYQRFQRSLNKEIMRRKWTPEEDEQLIELVKIFGEGNWQRIADYLDGRMGEQCMNRYMKACKPARKGRWTTEENDDLLEAVCIVGKLNWEKVAEYVPGRTGTQCRERYVNVVNPTLKKGPWDEEEDQKLLELVEKYGEGNWSQIAKNIVTRSDNQCWRHWNALRKEDSLHYRMNTLRKKREMVANFVNRRREKPDLRPEDLDIQDIPIFVHPRYQRKEMIRGSKKKRVKTEIVESDPAEESQASQSTGSPSSVMVPVTSIFDFYAPTPTIPNANVCNDTGIKDNHVTAPQTGHVITPEGTGHVGTKEETSHVGTKEESKRGVMGNHKMSAKKKRRVSESSDSDEEWNECVDTSEVGKRTSTRNKRSVNYSFDDDFISDLSQDGEDEQEEPVKQDKQGPQDKPNTTKPVPGDRCSADKPSISTTTTMKSTTPSAAPAPTPARLPARPPLLSPGTARPQVLNQSPAPAQAPPLAPAGGPTTRHSVQAPAAAPGTPRLPGPAAAQSQVPVQSSVTSFSLLLQAFNINVAGVLNKVRPNPSQDARRVSTMTATTTGQQSPLASSISEKTNPINQTGTSFVTSQQSHVVPLASNKEQSPQQTGQQFNSSKVCETSASASQRSSILHSSKDNTETRTQSPARRETPKDSSPKRTGEESLGITTRSPSKRKSRTPRKTRRFSEQQNTLEDLSDRIENIIQQNDKILATSKISNKPPGYHGNQNVELKKPVLPGIPPLPPCFTTLKGFKTLMSVKGQLEDLARQAVHTDGNEVSTTATTRTPSPTTSTLASAPAVKQEQKSKRSTSIQDKDPGKTKLTSTSSISTPRGPIESTSPSTPQPNTPPHVVDPRLSQDPFVRNFLYRKSNEYKLLSSRFNSLFMWPMVMSKVPLVGRIPKNLFKEPFKQYTQNWPFPHMFGSPVTSTSSSAATVDVRNPNTSANIVYTRPRKRSKQTNSSSASTPSNARTRAQTNKDKGVNKQRDTNKQTDTYKRTPRTQTRQKRTLKKGSVAFGEEVVPRKKRKVISVILGEGKGDKRIEEPSGAGMFQGTSITQEGHNGPVKTNDSSRKGDKRIEEPSGAGMSQGTSITQEGHNGPVKTNDSSSFNQGKGTTTNIDTSET